MNEKKPLKSEKHHWWPQVLSRRWANDDGIVSQIFPDGRVVPHSNPRNFGAIGNAHHIKLAPVPTVWDQSFESFFNEVDGSILQVIEWLQDLPVDHNRGERTLEDRLQPQPAQQENLDALLNLILSLIVRGPKFRDSVRKTVEHLRGRVGAPLPPAEESLISLNIRDSLERFQRSFLGSGKFGILVAKDAEYIFGDGFYHNFLSSAAAPISPQILIPLTPTRCVFYIRPISCAANPKLVTISATKEEVDFVNKTTQIYSGQSLFYRSQAPNLLDEFRQGRFLQYAEPHPTIEILSALMCGNRMIHSL